MELEKYRDTAGRRKRIRERLLTRGDDKKRRGEEELKMQKSGMKREERREEKRRGKRGRVMGAMVLVFMSAMHRGGIPFI